MLIVNSREGILSIFFPLVVVVKLRLFLAILVEVIIQVTEATMTSDDVDGNA